MRLKIDGKRLILFQLQYLFVIKLIIDVFPGLSPAMYLADMLSILILLDAIKKIYKIRTVSFAWLILLVCSLLFYDLIELLIRKQGVLLFLWGVRNQYRFILFTVSSALILTRDDIEEVIKVIKRWFKINIPIVTIEYLLGYKMDFLGGTFGLERGCNAIVNIFLCVVVSITIVSWLNKKSKTLNMLFYMFFSLYWGVLSELKMFFIEFIIIIILALFLVRKNETRKLHIIFVSIIGIFVAINALAWVFPYYSNFFNIASIISYAKNVNLGYAGFGRISAIPQITSLFFKENFDYILFGLGVGSAEFSGISFLNSQIYETFKQYQYFSYFHAFMYVERGIIGLIWYLLFFGSSIIIGIRSIRGCNDRYTYLMQMSIIISICSIITMIYDIGLRTSTSGYLAFLMCSLPYLLKLRSHHQKVGEDKVYDCRKG